jgi:uncharacterized protein YjdB
MKSKKLTLLLAFAIAAQTVLTPLTSLGSVYAASEDTVIIAAADSSEADAAESNEEITSSDSETDTKESTVSDDEESASSGESTDTKEPVTGDEDEAPEDETLEDLDSESAEDLESLEDELIVEDELEAVSDDESEDSAELLGKEVEDATNLLGDPFTEGTVCDVKVMPKIYNYYNDKGYGFAFAIKTQDSANETFESVKDLAGAEIRIQVDNEYSTVFYNGNEWSTGYAGKYVTLKGDYLSKDIKPGMHTIKVAVKRNGVWYTGSANTEFIYEDIKNQNYDVHPEGSEIDYHADFAYNSYFSAKAGGLVKDVSLDMGSGYTELNASGHQFKSVKLVKHGTDTSVANGYRIRSGWSGSWGVNEHYKSITRDYTNPDIVILQGISSKMPADCSLSLYCSFSIEKDIDEGWYDVVAVADSGAKARFNNAYYGTKKTILYHMGYKMWNENGNVLNSKASPYVAAYIYGLNISEDALPTYYKDGKALTGTAAYKERIVNDEGYSFLLNRLNPDDAIWDNDTVELDIAQTGLPEGFLDLTPEYFGTKIDVDLNDEFDREYETCYWADNEYSDLDYYGKATFEVKELDGMEPLYSGSTLKGTSVAEMIPVNQRYKFDPNKIYRVIVYDQYDHAAAKEYYTRFKTGEATADSVSVSVSPAEATIQVGGTVKLNATVEPDSIADKSVTYKSSKTSVATVDADGTVTGVAPGTCDITVTTKTGGKKATAKITVVEKVVPVKGISISKEDKVIALLAGDSHEVTYTLDPADATENDVEFTSSDEAVVKTNAKDGLIYAVGAGSATVTLKVSSPSAGSSYEDTCKVTVTKAPVTATSISLDHNEITLKPGSSYTLHATVNPFDADVKTVSWRSTDTGVVNVKPSEDGLSAVAVPFGPGEAVIVIEHKDGCAASCKVTVLGDDSSANGDEKPEEEEHDIWISMISDQTYTGGKLAPRIRVYDGSTELVNGTDYTVTYSNNTNVGHVGDKDSKGKDIAPKATVKFKGNYKGIALYRSFNIVPLSIETGSESDFFDASDIAIDFKAGKTYSPVPVLTRNGKKLKAGADYSYAYLSGGKAVDKITEAGHYEIEISGKGNYSGTIKVNCDAFSKGAEYVPMSSLAIKVDPASYEYDAKGVTPAYTVTYDGKPVDEKLYSVSYLNDSNKRVGTATIVFRSSGETDGYKLIGEKRVPFKITGTALNKAADVSGITDKAYTGEEITQDAVKVTLKADTAKELKKDEDYKVTYSNNINAGTATVTFTGIGGYTGTLKKTFKISKVSDADITVAPVSDVPFVKGGAKPVPTVTYNGKTLKVSKDFTVSYKNNNVVTTDSVKNKPEIIIKFKGNYEGQKTVDFNIAAQSIAALNASVPDKAYSAKANAWMSAPVITDLDGKKLQAGTDYEKLTAADYDYMGKNWGAVPAAGSKVTVTVKGKGNYSGTIKANYYIFANNISKAKFKIADQQYTGMNISLDKEDFTTATLNVKENGKSVTKTLVLNKDFEIVSYEKNIKTGTAAVYVRGIGGDCDLGGIRKLTFKIVAKDSSASSSL